MLGAALYILAINVATFGAFAADKRRAEQRLWRIPERALLWLAMAGGTSGAIAGQQILRHKTRKEPFRTLLWLIAFAQAVAIGALLIVSAPQIGL
jgi:uncharacterized membrane protein YsdA (DUF1294 family)